MNMICSLGSSTLTSAFFLNKIKNLLAYGKKVKFGLTKKDSSDKSTTCRMWKNNFKKIKN